MKTNQHEIAAKKHFSIAQDIDKEIESESDEDKKLALMTVAAQNYFYAGTNAIEFVFSKLKTPMHSGTHEHRLRNVLNNIHLFKNNEVISLYTDVDQLRNSIAYRAVNGHKYKRMRRFAEVAMDEINE